LKQPLNTKINQMLFHWVWVHNNIINIFNSFLVEFWTEINNQINEIIEMINFYHQSFDNFSDKWQFYDVLILLNAIIDDEQEI
jgi:site-specific DNA-adenine methylase